MRRILCIILALILAVSMAAVPAFASDSSDGSSADGYRDGLKDYTWGENIVKYEIAPIFDILNGVWNGANAFAENVTDTIREEFQANVLDSIEFWKDVVDALTYDKYVSTLDSTTASPGISVTGFRATTVGPSVDNNGPYSAFANLSKSYPSEFTSLLKSLGIADKVAILSIGYDSPYDLVGVYWDVYGRLTQANFVNPLGVRNASLYGVYSLSDLELISSGLTEVHETDLVGYSTGLFYNKSFAEAQSDFLLGTYVAVDWSSEISYSYFGTSKAPVFRCFFKNSANTVWNSSSRDLGLYSAPDAYWVSYPPSLTGLVWDNSRIIIQPSGTTSTSRPGSFSSSITNYNTYNFYGDDATVVNYYIGTTDDSGELTGIFDFGIFDEDTMIFTDPETGTEYQATDWSYDYTTRTYDITFDAGTMTVNDTDITQVLLTYGDKAVTIQYYDASGNLIDIRSYVYLQVAQTGCAITGHSYTYETIKEATCTHPGERKYTCSGCGNQYAEDIPKLEHSFTNYTVEKEPTCTNHGLAVNTCLTCGSEVTELLDPLGHDWLPTSITDESWVMPDNVNCPDCHGTNFTHARSDYEIVRGKNLYHIVDGFTSGSKNGVSIDFDPSTMEYTLNGTLTLRGDLFLGVVDPEWLVGEDYTITVFKTGGTVEFTSSSYSTFAFSLFTRNSDNFVRASSISTEFPDEYSFTCPAIAPSGGDGFIVYLQCWSIGTVFTDFKFKVQIEKGSVATEYEPYTSSEVEIIPPIYNFTCQDCSTEWTAEAVYQHAYTTFTCSRCDETMIKSEDPDSGLFASIGNLLADAVTWVTDKLSQLVDSLSGLNDLFQEYMEQIRESGGEYPAFLAAFVALLPEDLMTVLWFSLIAVLVLAAWKKWFS